MSRHLEGKVESNAVSLDNFDFAAISPRGWVTFYCFGKGPRVELIVWRATEPNNNSPLNVDAADLWDDKEAVRGSSFCVVESLGKLTLPSFLSRWRH